MRRMPSNVLVLRPDYEPSSIETRLVSIDVEAFRARFFREMSRAKGRAPMRTKRPRTDIKLLCKIRMGLWSPHELEWLLQHLGESLTPDTKREIRSKLYALQGEPSY
jgi:hypothetical protein